MSPSSPDAASGADRLAAVAALSEQLPRFMRVVHALKAQLAGPDSRDRAALVLLFPLARQGPLRQSALAELVHADPSTVSRHVAALVDEGLVRRVADETDGRASRLVVTEAGHAALDSLRAERTAHLEQVTADWDPTDLATLTTLFGRLVDDIAAGLPGTAAEPAPTRTTTDQPRENR
ncbi:MarR family transcriptional regulator [Blastococcus montanus]|uniref:MarR family winged helix-turn-helix transcriptional regulator n=1 Tax=Blastococcus montanus TaxID=3144973 RepID=UPI00320819B7